MIEPVNFDSRSGYFQRLGKRFIPVGVNYWPGSTGVDMWKRWSPIEMNNDLDLIAKMGFNTVRFFLRWQDFEPEQGKIDRYMLAHLEDFMIYLGKRGLYAHPSLFVGWMSGGVFWPDWFRGRNLFNDPELITRAESFCREVGQILYYFREHILAFDQGNELDCLPETYQASPSEIVSWCGRINTAIREVFPGAVIVSGNEQNQLMNDTGWRFGAQPGTDFYSMHGYPVPGWHPLRFDGMTDPLAQSLLPAYISAARAYGSVMLQEFGTIVTFGKEQQDAYLRGLLPACWESGANGFLWWCFRDIKARTRPYLTNGFEGTLGLVDAQGKVKPGLNYFLEFIQGLEERLIPDLDQIETGIFLSSQYYPRENPECPGHTPAQQARGLALARYFSGQMGIPTRCVRGDQPIPGGLKTIVIAGPHLRVDEASTLEDWVEAGGRLVWHGPDPVNYGPLYIRLVGANPLDYRAALPSTVLVNGQAFEFTHYPRDLRLEVGPVTARVAAHAQDGLPVVLVNLLGKGKVVSVLPQVEETIAVYSANRERRDAWKAFYHFVFDQ